jgi:hypothetical protein
MVRVLLPNIRRLRSRGAAAGPVGHDRGEVHFLQRRAALVPGAQPGLGLCGGGIAAGQQEWAQLPALPVPVHGMGGVMQGNGFYIFGGSSVAAQAVNTGAVQVLRW